MKIGNNWFRYGVALAAVAFCALGALAGSGSSAAITDVTARQRYPWNGKVDIAYTVTDVARTATDLGMDPAIKVLAVDRTTTPWTTNVADSSALFVGPLGVEALTDDVATSDGTHKIVWDMNAQGLTFASTNVIFAVLGGAKEPGVQLWENGPYFAECNVGASKPEEYGYYFWWGDTVGYKRNSANNGWVSSKDGTTAFSFSSGNCPTYDKTVDQLTTDGYIDGAGNLVADHDAATAHLGAPWRMPTAAELKALVANCTTSWITTNGVNGRLVKGKDGYASKSIFLPAAGYGNNSNHNNASTHGRYWSSTPDSSGSDVAGYLYIYASSLSATMISRYYGQSVRPVRIASGGGSSLPSLLCTGESDPVRADLRTGTRVAAPTEALTYSAAWCGGDSVALAANGETLAGAGALTGSGTYNWTPNKVGTIALTHTVVTGGVPVVLTATFTVLSVPEVEVKVPDPMPENTWFSVLTNGVTVEQTGDRFLVPSNATDVTVLFTAASGYYFEDGSTVITKTVDTSKNPATIQGTIPSAPARKDYYVSTTGSDANDGSPTAPFATITNAIVKSAGRKTTIHVMTDLVQDRIPFKTMSMTNTTDITILSDDNNPATTDDQFTIYPSNDGSRWFWELGDGTHLFNANLSLTNIVFDGRIGGSTGSSQYSRGGIYMFGGGTLRLQGGCVIRNFMTANGSEVRSIVDKQYGTLCIESGSFLTNNTIRSGRSVYTTNPQSVINVGGQGTEGVSNGVLRMTGGLITGNTAVSSTSAMINLGTTTKAYLTGGVISNNVMYASDSYACYKRMQSETTANDSDYYFGGTIIVSDNKDTNGKQKNIHIPSGSTSHLSMALTGDAKIGLYIVGEVAGELCVADGADYTPVTEDTAHIAMDRDVNYHVFLKDSDKKIYVAHHTWTYAVDSDHEDTLYAYCPFSGCPYSGSASDLSKAIFIRLVTPDGEHGTLYSGAYLEGTNVWFEAGLTNPPLSYAMSGSSSYAATAPSAYGDYIAKATISNDLYAISGFSLTSVVAFVDVKEPSPAIDHTTFKVLTNGVEIAKIDDRWLVPTNSADVTVVYTADPGCYFEDGSTAKTNTVDTSTNPATIQGKIPSAPHPSIKYTQPIYVNNIASNGIERWETNTVYVYTVVTSAMSQVTWGEEGATNWLAVTNADVKIKGGVVCKGHVNLILCKGAKLTVDDVKMDAAGIATDGNGSFVIYGQSDGAGELEILGGYDGAGIGGGGDDEVVSVRHGSNITINGGKVTVTAKGGGAGIGGGYDYGDGSNITINGGEVTATGGYEGGAGIGGGGYYGNGSNITINGGEVTATGGYLGSGIGGGYTGDGSNITINGGKVTATSNCGGAGIGGGSDSAGSNITISNATVFVVGVAMCLDGVYYYPDCIGNGGDDSYHDGGIVIDPSAKIFFNLTGSWDYKAKQWIEELMPMPADFDGFVIMTPETQTVDRVLVGGLSGLPGGQPLPTFALTNAATGATGTIAVNGANVLFAERLLDLPYADGKLTLKAYEYSTINPPTEVANTTVKVYTNDAEVAVGTGLIVTTDTPAYIVYIADSGYTFTDGTTAKTNQLDMTVNPAKMQGTLPVAVVPVEYTCPIYVGGVASNGIERWETNTCYIYTVVTSQTSAATWGEEGATNWLAVTNADVKIKGGVVCKGHVNLILCKGAKLTVDDVEIDAAGIATDGSGSFVIYGQSDGAGELNILGGFDGAGIGGGCNGTGSNITINGGKVTVTAEGGGAGIGGGEVGAGLNITINGGKVTATGGNSGAGIGGGYIGDGSNITINGGKVTATGGEYGAGIGGGLYGHGSNITINGGKVTATSNGGGGAGIGGGSDGAGSNITISNATVFVVGVARCLDGVYYYPDCIGNGGDVSYHAGGIVIDPSAKIFFNLTGSWDYNNGWIKELMPMPADFDGFTIMTPETQTVDRVLVGGLSGLPGGQPLPFALTNAVTGATGTIKVDGGKVLFAERLLGLPYADGKLTLKAYEYSTITPPTEIPNATVKVYTNDAEVAVGSGLIVTAGTPAYVVYEAESGYTFTDGTTAKTNQLDTTVNPAKMQGTLPVAVVPVEYTCPIYVGGVASNGIERWETNTCYVYTVVTSQTSAATWGETGATNWFVVTNADVKIDGGVTCAGCVNLILYEGAKLLMTNVAEGAAGIATDANGSFTIYGQPDGAGELSSYSGEGGAGIGGGTSDDGTAITINGGKVTAVSISGGAGIGSGQSHHGDPPVGRDITINGGTVTAIGGERAAAIGGGNGGEAEGITINGGNVLVSSDQYAQSIGSGELGDDSCDVVISSAAKVFFNLSDTELLPADFDGFVIMTPMTQTVDRVLVGGLSGLSGGQPLPAFALTNAVTGATGTIMVDGADVFFAERLLSLPYADGKLTLKAYEYTVVNDPEDVEHMSKQLFTNGVEVALGSGIKVRRGTEIYAVYTADEKYFYPDSSTVSTNRYDTSVNPATVTPPPAPFIPVASVTTNAVTTLYGNITSAWDDACIETNGTASTLKLLMDVELPKTLLNKGVYDTSASLTVDLNDCVISPADGHDECLLYFAADRSVSVVDNATTKSNRYFTVREDGLWVLTNEVTALSVAGGLITGSRMSAIQAVSNLTLRGVSFVGNSSSASGGAIYAGSDSELLINGCQFRGNRSNQSGGGVYTKNKCVVIDTVIDGNASVTGGGGVCYEKEVGDRVLVLGANTIITNNTAAGAVDNLYLASADSLIALDEVHNGIIIGVRLATGSGRFTTNTVSGADAALFTSDNTDYIVAYNTNGYLELCPPPEEVLPTPLDNTTSIVTTNGVEVVKDDEGKYIVPSNTLVRIIYTITDDDYIFEDGGTTFITEEFPADGTPGTPAELMPDAPTRYWFESTTLRFDARKKIVVFSPDEVLPIAYSTNFFGEVEEPNVPDHSYVSEKRDVALSASNIVETIAANGTEVWQPVEGEFGRYELIHSLATNATSAACRNDYGYIYYTTNASLQLTATEGGSIAAFTNGTQLAAVSDPYAFSEIVMGATLSSELWTFDGWVVTNATGAAVPLSEVEPSLTNRFEMPLAGAGVMGKFRYIGVEVKPADAACTWFAVYTNGGEVVKTPEGEYFVITNSLVDVVYTASNNCHFVDGSTVKTNTFVATKDPTVTSCEPAFSPHICHGTTFTVRIDGFAALTNFFEKGGNGYLVADIVIPEADCGNIPEIQEAAKLCLNGYQISELAEYEDTSCIKAFKGLELVSCDRSAHTERFWKRGIIDEDRIVWTNVASLADADYVTTGGVCSVRLILSGDSDNDGAAICAYDVNLVGAFSSAVVIRHDHGGCNVFSNCLIACNCPEDDRDYTVHISGDADIIDCRFENNYGASDLDISRGFVGMFDDEEKTNLCRVIRSKLVGGTVNGIFSSNARYDVIIEDGEVTGHECGVYAGAGCRLIVGGTTIVTNNFNAEGAARNLYFLPGESELIEVSAENPLTKDSAIGVGAYVWDDIKGDYVSTTGVFCASNDVDYTECFLADASERMAVLYNEKFELELSERDIAIYWDTEGNEFMVGGGHLKDVVAFASEISRIDGAIIEVEFLKDYREGGFNYSFPSGIVFTVYGDTWYVDIPAGAEFVNREGLSAEKYATFSGEGEMVLKDASVKVGDRIGDGYVTVLDLYDLGMVTIEGRFTVGQPFVSGRAEYNVAMVWLWNVQFVDDAKIVITRNGSVISLNEIDENHLAAEAEGDEVFKRYDSVYMAYVYQVRAKGAQIAEGGSSYEIHAESEDAAREIAKDTYIVSPDADAEELLTIDLLARKTYQSLFSCVVTPVIDQQQYKVEVVMTAAATNSIKAACDAAVASIAENTKQRRYGQVPIETKPGIYYCVKGSDELEGDYEQEGDWVLGTGYTEYLEFIGTSKKQHFYEIEAVLKP